MQLRDGYSFAGIGFKIKWCITQDGKESLCGVGPVGWVSPKRMMDACFVCKKCQKKYERQTAKGQGESDGI